MSEKRVQFSNIVQNQLPVFVRDEYPLISEFLKQYYIGQEYVSGPLDLIQNIDQYIKVDNFTNLNEELILSNDITSYDDVIVVSNPINGTAGFPSTYGLIKIDDEIITYTGLTNGSFTGCIRGFCGISSYKSDLNPESLVFESTNAKAHLAGATITNLSCLFLKEFLTKTKYQILPGFEEREISENVNKNVFIKQSKDFYTSKGTDLSFEILFKALYEEDVKVVKPRDYLFTPSNAHYKISNDLVVESIEGDPLDLIDGTLYQDEYLYDSSITKAYAPITNIEKVIPIEGEKTFYRLSFDSGYNRDVRVSGALYGDFSVHPKTKLIGQVSTGQSTFDVDSTVGFGNNGELYVTYNDSTVGIVSYTSKSLTQFYGCSNVVGIISDKSNIGINTFAWGRSFKDQNKKIKVRINSVLKNIEYPDNTTYYGKDNVAKIRTLGIDDSNFKGKNWIYNIAPSYKVKSIELIDSDDFTYKVTLYNDSIFKEEDTAQIIGTDNIIKNTNIISILSKYSFIVKGQGVLNSNDTFIIKRNILKVNTSTFIDSKKYETNVQNVYKQKYDENYLVASSSIPSYPNIPIDNFTSSNQSTSSPRSSIFSGTYQGDTFNIGKHTFYTGDAVYYIPQKVKESYYNWGRLETRTVVKSSLFASDIGPLQNENEIAQNEGLYYIKRVSSDTIMLAKSRNDIYNSKFISLSESTTVTDCILQEYEISLKTLDNQKLLRGINPPENDSTVTKTTPGATGILINGVEILNYKSSDIIQYGKLEEIEVLAEGGNYDIINPLPLNISDVVGTGATGYLNISGSLKEIQIIDPGFDYVETPSVEISGGNGKGATASARMTLVDYKAAFNSQENGQEVKFGETQSTIGFSTYHKFRNAESIIYITDNQKGIAGLSTNTVYYISSVNDTTVKLHPTLADSIAGINTVIFTNGGVGRHYLQAYNKKSIIEAINVVESGSGYETKKTSTLSAGISTSLNEITIKNHGYEKGEILTYTVEGTTIGGLSNGTDYYVTKIDENKFKLSSSDFLCKTNQYIDFTSVGAGKHIFNYPDISVKIVGEVGISSIGSETFEAEVQPIFRGQIKSVFLSNQGVGYGSSEIVNFKRSPDISLVEGSNAQVEITVSDGVISDVIILNGGTNYTSIPDLVLTGDGFGAALTPIIKNGSLNSVKIISGGKGYSNNSVLTVIPSGSNAKFNTVLQKWTINLFNKYFSSFSEDDGFITNGINPNYGLQFFHLYAPRPLRKNIFSVDQSGKILYGNKDLKISNGEEIESTDHSPIIGWAYDGNPIYGPYGYSTSKGGVVTQMLSGYNKVVTTENRPPDSIFEIGFFIEDYQYQNTNNESILDENNGRFGITPEFPNGTYAYFSTLDGGSNTASSGPFDGYKVPAFPYLVGDNFYSLLNEFNYRKSSNQDDINLSHSNWVRNTQPYNLIEDELRYDYVYIPNDLDQTMDIKGVKPGIINSIGIETGGNSYKVGDNVVFDNNETGGYGIASKVSKVLGKSVDNISVASSIISGVEIYPSSTKGEYILFTDNPHNFENLDIISISGLSTSTTKIEGSYSIGITTTKLVLSGIGTTNSVGVSSAEHTGIVTYFNVGGDTLDSIRENDILGIGTEKVKVLNVSPTLSRIRILREYDGTVGQGHSAGTPFHEYSKKLTIKSGVTTNDTFKLNRELYFNPSETVGLGTTAGVGIGTILRFRTNPIVGGRISNLPSISWRCPDYDSSGMPILPTSSGIGLTQKFIQSQSLYIPSHGLETGDKLTYFSNGGDPIVSWDISSSTDIPLIDGQTLYAAAITNDLVGLATVKVGLGTTGTFVGIAETVRNSSILYFSGLGTSTYHSLKTNYDSITGEITRRLVTVATSQTHGLISNDNVYIDVNPSISTTFVVKYNDYNRKVLVGVKTFTSSNVNTTLNTISINDHGFISGDKIVYTSTTPITGLTDNEEYYIVKVDNNSFKLSNSYYNSTQILPFIINLQSAEDGSIGLINPPLKVYKNSTVKFDLSDSSLSYTNQGTLYPAFELNFYTDSEYVKQWDKNTNIKDFNVERTGIVGIDTNANVTLIVNNEVPEVLYYKLDPVYESNNIPLVKSQISIDSDVISNSEINLKSSVYNGKKIIAVASTTSFTYTLNESPEQVSYASTLGPILSYDTDSLSASGPIVELNMTNRGRNYYELPGITTITTVSGQNAEINVSSNSLGSIKKIGINDIGFDFASDTTLSPYIKLPQSLEVVSYSSLDYVAISSFGNGYTVAPKLIVLDGKTRKKVPDIDLKYTLGQSNVSILKNTYGISDAIPTIIPTQNTNGVGISTVEFNSSTKNVIVTLSIGFTTANSFPFAVNDKVMIEGISVGVGSTGKGYNSEEYDYKFFTITEVEENIGGIGSITYSLSNDLLNGEIPGIYDEFNSSGRIISTKNLPIIEFKIKSNDYIVGETVKSDSSTGIVDYWNNKTGILRISSDTNFVVNEKIEGLSSKTQGIASSIRSYDSYAELGPFSLTENGWVTDSGVLNNTIQRIQDNDYYQNFSYSLRSRVPYQKWHDAVSSLNHTLGFKKFADYSIESSSISDYSDMPIGISTNVVNIITDLNGFANLNCVSSFDLVKENSLNLNGKIVSTEIIFSNRVLQDYMESINNRVISIDDISPNFNSHPRPTRYSVIETWPLSEMTARKFITFVEDKRYVGESQLMIVDLLHDNSMGYINQYARVSSLYDQGSFDFKVNGLNGELLFYPTKYEVNDFWVTSLSYNLDKNLTGIGSTSLDGIALVSTSSTTTSPGITTNIVSIGNTYSAAKVLIEVTPDTTIDEYEYDELNIVHNGTDVAMLEYGQLTSNTQNWSLSGYGTYYPYLDGSDLKVDFVPNAGIGTTAIVNTIIVGLANSMYSGIGTMIFNHSKLEAVTTTISASGSPTENMICEYEDDYDGAYFIVQVCDKTNNEYQLSEVAIVDNYSSETESGNIYCTEWANIETSVGLGTIGSRLNGSTAELLFTPTANIDVEVNVFMNALKIKDDITQSIEFNEGSIQSGIGYYEGTDRDIKRAFGLTHNTYPIFERYFLGNDSSIVSVDNNTIRIPNHFYVSGEKIKYYHVGTAVSAIGCVDTNFPGIGNTEFLPEDLFAVKVSDDAIKIASTAENALKSVPVTVDITSVGIGTSHRFVATNQNPKILNALDNIIQSPIVSTSITSHLADQVFVTDNLIPLSGITSFFGSDLIKIGDEIMKIEGVGIGSTNVIRVRRPWLGTSLSGYGTDTLVTKVTGNYNIVDNVLNYTEAPYGNRPIGSTTNPPDDRDWTGITTSSTFQGRVFMKSGVTGSTDDTYSKNYIFDDISHNFDGTNDEFTLKSNKANITGITTQSIILINDVWQGRGLSSNYTTEESAGITSITFVGSEPTIINDVNISPYPVGGVIVSVGSTEGFGYQPLVAAGGKSKVSTAGTVSSISIGYSGSGYRSGIGQTVNVSIQEEDLVTTNIVSIGTAIIGSTGSLTGVAITNPHVFYKPRSVANVGYNSITGMSKVTTLTPHGLSNGSEVVLSGIAFTCTYSTPKSISNVGYHTATGIMTVTTSSPHGYIVDQDVIFTGIAMTCQYDAVNPKYYPRGEDPAYDTAVSIASTTGTTITVNVGYGAPTDQFEHTFVNATSGAVISGGDYIHQFVSAETDAISVTGWTTSLTPTNVTYDAVSGLVTFTSDAHTLTTSDTIGVATDSLSLRCSMDNYSSIHTYPRSTDPIHGNTTVAITATTTDTFTINVGASPLVTHNVSDAEYSANVGVMTMTIGAHTLKTGESIKLATESLSFTCSKDSNATTHKYPRKPDPYYNGSRITSIINNNEFVTNIGISTVETFYVSGGTVQGAIIAPRAINKSSSKSDPASGQATINNVIDDYNFMVSTGISTCSHFYARGGKVEKSMKVIFDDPLSYSNIPLQYSSSSAVGIGSSAVVNIQVGQDSSVTNFTLTNTGYGFGNGEILTVPIGGSTGIPTTSGFKEFNLTVDQIFTDKFTGWSIGDLQTLDNVEKYIDGERVNFPLLLAGDRLSILASKGSKIVLHDLLIVFVNDILQVPNQGYTFTGGSIITFTEAPKIGDTIKISFYKGSGIGDVILKPVLETVKPGDDLTIGYDPSIGQEPYLQEDTRTVTEVTTTDFVETSPYYGPGNTQDLNLLRPVVWCRQTEDKIINDLPVSKDRELYEANINPTAYIIKTVGIGSTSIWVDNLRPFFDPENENDTDVSFQNSITLYNQDKVVGASATAVVSGLGTISSIVLSSGGTGYLSAPIVSIASTTGINTSTMAMAEAIIANGTVTGIAITNNGGIGYTSSNPPQVLIDPPVVITERDKVNSYSGDNGVIVGFGTDDDSGIDKLIFDFFIPDDSYLRDPLVVGTALTLSTIQVNDFFVVTQSNVGLAETSLVSRDVDQNIIGVGTQFVDNVYQASEVSIVEVSFVGAEASKIGIGTTNITRVKANISGVSTENFSNTSIYFDSTQYTFDNIGSSSGVSGMNTIGGGTTSSISFGNFSWGRIELDSRTKSISYPAYTLGGIGIGGTTNPTGIHTSSIVVRTEKLKSKNYAI